MISNNKKGMYNIRHPIDQYIQIGDSGLIRVEAIGDINLVFHQLDEHGNPEDVEARVQDVIYTPWLGFNLFSIWKVGHKIYWHRRVVSRRHEGTLTRYTNWRWRGESGGVKRVVCRSPNETELPRLCTSWVYGTVDFVPHLPNREKIETKPRSANHILHTRHNVLRVSVFI